MTSTQTIFTQIMDERRRQDEKWGEQNILNPEWLAVITEELGEVAEAVLQHRFSPKEQVRANGLEDLRCELVQVAAVAVAWVEALDRQEAPDDAG